MKLLLDESIPRQLGSRFPDSFETRTVQRMGWAGRGNGALLRLAHANGFDAFITADQGIEHQQNPDRLPLPVLILIAHRTRITELDLIMPQVIDLLTSGLTKTFYRVTGSREKDSQSSR